MFTEPSRLEPGHSPKARSRPFDQGSPSNTSRARHALCAIALASTLLGLSGALAVAGASVLPPYAEQWSPPGQPEDVDVDPTGRVWVTCSDDMVRVYRQRGGTLLMEFGGTGEGDGQFHDPFGIQFAPDGTVYICDYAGARVQRFTGDGDFLQAWPIPSERADHVAVDDFGDVYVTGFSNGFVHKYDATGNPLTAWPSQGGGRPSGIFAVGGVLHVASWEIYEIEQYALDGTYLGSFPIETAFGVDLEQDAFGQLWLADWTGHVIRVYSASGEPIEVLGGPGADPGEFNGPIGIAFGVEGSVYVADQLNGRVQRFGDVTMDVPAASASPAALAIRSLTPNPSLGAVSLTYSIPRAGRVAVTIADMAGRRVANLGQELVTAGEHRVTWDVKEADGRELAAGHYFIRLESETGTGIGRFVVVR